MARQIALAFLLPILLACAAILAAYFFLQAQDNGAMQGGEISMSLPSGPLVSGNTAALRAVSTCGAFHVSLDGSWFGSGEPLISKGFSLEEGSHSFFAQGKGCNATLVFFVLARECAGNEAKECEKNGCPGAQECAGGIFSDCALPKKVCSPGEKVGCSINGCSFGYITCNPCGTSFGKCTAGSKKENASCAGN
ncbi:MAG: hypothetical protein NTX79_08505 [Candidatus Micrarchaeota archaeon]|nr:hypothetical protein [Candidatus Micrarchaeota archaeon]